MAVPKMMCPACSAKMNHHAEKIDHLATMLDPAAIDPDLDGVVQEMHACPKCGNSASRRSTS
jgi:ribosomal protein S27AE